MSLVPTVEPKRTEKVCRFQSGFDVSVNISFNLEIVGALGSGQLCVQDKLEAAWRPEADLCADNGLPIARQLQRLHTACTPVARRLHAGRTGVGIRQQMGKWEAIESDARARPWVPPNIRDGRSQFDIPGAPRVCNPLNRKRSKEPTASAEEVCLAATAEVAIRPGARLVQSQNTSGRCRNRRRVRVGPPVAGRRGGGLLPFHHQEVRKGSGGSSRGVSTRRASASL